MSEYIDYEVSDGIAEIVLDRPEVMNAFNETMLRDLNVALEDAMADDGAYVVILTGAGDGFCSGGDMQSAGERNAEIQDQESPSRAKREYIEYADRAVQVVRMLRQGAKPTIAAVNGPAIGAGCDFALGCDLRVISEDAIMREQFVNVGMAPADGGGYLLPKLVGESKAREYILTGRDITAADAEELGLVVDVVEPGTALSVARDLAAEIRDKPAFGVRTAKSLIGTHRSFEEYVTEGLERQWEARNDPEQAEAVQAFVEGREPEYDRNY